MTRIVKFLAFALALMPVSGQAQYNSSAIEKLCYGGRNQMGLHVCACDQTWISGLSALILGNSTPQTGSMTLASCLEWADERNGVTGKRIAPPKVATKPKTPPTKAPPPQIAKLPETAGRCGAQFNSCTSSDGRDCVSRFNACEGARTETNLNAAVEKDYLSPDTARQWSALSAIDSTSETTPPDQNDGTADTGGAAASGGMISDNWNTGGCDLTTQARFTLGAPTQVNRLETWINWDETGGDSVRATLSGELQMALTYVRKECHPNMPNWCRGTAYVNRALPAGDYLVTSAMRAMCENVGSGHNGYVRVFGTTADSPPTLSAEDRIRSKPFNFRFDCPGSDLDGQFRCGKLYWAKYTPSSNTWEVCGAPVSTSEETCLAYANAPASGATFSAWGTVMDVREDGTLVFQGRRVGTVLLDQDAQSAARAKPKLPTLSYKPPALGLPGNRKGTGYR